MPDLSHVCDLHHSSQPHQTLNPLSGARDQILALTDTSQVHYHRATMGTPRIWIHMQRLISLNDTVDAVYIVMLVLGFSSRFYHWLPPWYTFLIIHVMIPLSLCFVSLKKIVISYPVTDNSNVPTQLFFPNFEFISLGRRLEIAGGDCFSLLSNDSVFGLKLIFTAN